VRADLEVADIFRAAGTAYRAAHAGHLSLTQLKVMSAIEHCRTALALPHLPMTVPRTNRTTSARHARAAADA